MPTAKKSSARKRILWTADDVRYLKSNARRVAVSKIAKQLRRSEAAVRYKATTLRISLAVRRR
jgi:hypothetical protein